MGTSEALHSRDGSRTLATRPPISAARLLERSLANYVNC
jgi:hypothetical protein